MKKNIIVSIIALAFICTFSSCKIDNADENYTQRGFVMYKTWENNFNYFFPRIEFFCTFNAWRNAPAEEKAELQKTYFNNYSIRDLGNGQWILLNKGEGPTYMILSFNPLVYDIIEYPHNAYRGDSILYSLSQLPEDMALERCGTKSPCWEFVAISERGNDELARFCMDFTIPYQANPQVLPATLASEPINILKGNGVILIDNNKYPTPDESSADHLEFEIPNGLHYIYEPGNSRFMSGELELKAYNQYGKSKNATAQFEEDYVTIFYNNHSEKYCLKHYIYDE